MHPHEVPHQHVHMELPKELYEAIKRLHPGYGGVTQALRKLVSDYVEKHTAKRQGEAA
jgi:hypothetical protein